MFAGKNPEMDAQLLAAELGVAAGLVGAYVHRRGGVRAWLPHLAMGAAMAAMAAPRQDLLGPPGWMLVLAGAAAWSLGRPGAPGGWRPRAAVALDLYVMGVLALLMPAVHGGAHSGGVHGSSSGWWDGPYVAVIAVWAVTRTVLAVAEHRRPPAAAKGGGSAVSSACSGVMIGAMALMAFAP